MYKTSVRETATSTGRLGKLVQRNHCLETLGAALMLRNTWPALPGLGVHCLDAPEILLEILGHVFDEADPPLLARLVARSALLVL